MSRAEVAEHPRGLVEEDRAALAAGGMSDGLGEVRLADADRADQEHRLLALDEAAGGEIADLGCGDLGVEGEVEVGERPLFFEARAPDAIREGLVGAALDLVLEHQLQELEVPELLLVRLIEPQLERLEHPAELEALEAGLQLQRVHLAACPTIASGPWRNAPADVTGSSSS